MQNLYITGPLQYKTYAKDMPKIWQRYTRSNSKLQIQNIYLKQRYAKDFQLFYDLYKLSQLRLAVTAVKAVQLLEDLYKLS